MHLMEYRERWELIWSPQSFSLGFTGDAGMSVSASAPVIHFLEA